MQLYTIALAPGILVLLYIVLATSFTPVVKLNFIIAFLLGMAATGPAAGVQLATRFFWGTTMNQAGPFLLGITAFITVALSEEGSKFLVVRYYAFPRKGFDGPETAMIFSLLIAVGFASIEQLGYASRNGIRTALLRTLITIPAHLVFGCIMGYYAGRAKKAPRTFPWLATGLLLAILCHGSFDFILFLQQAGYLTDLTGRLLLYGVITASTLLALQLYRRAVQDTHRSGDRQINRVFKQNDTMESELHLQPAGPGDIEAIRSLAMAIWPDTYADILTPGQILYMMDQMYSPEALATQMQQHHQFLLATDAGRPVGFASWSAAGDPGIAKLQKIYVLRNLQQKGVGKFLVTAVASLAGAAGCSRLQLNVNRGNPAITFYERQGFAIIREEDIDIGEGYFMNDYVMERSL